MFLVVIWSVTMFKNANFFISEFFKSLVGNKPTQNITPKIANSIQKQEYFNSFNEFEPSYTPSYVLIGYQLRNDKKEIFEASVHYLCVIASNVPQYKDDIMNVLYSYIAENKRLTDRVYFFEHKIKDFDL